MSRIGKQAITITKGVEVKIDGNFVRVKGPKGQLDRELHPTVEAKIDGDKIYVTLREDIKLHRRFHGLSRTLLANMIEGCSVGYNKKLTLIGVGYRAAADGKGLKMSLGFSHPIHVKARDGIEFKVEKNTNIVVSGPSKEVVGQVSADIRSLRPPEPYHGKGVRYADENIITKVGKAAGKK